MYLGLARFVLVSKEDDKNAIYRTDANGQKGFVNLGFIQTFQFAKTTLTQKRSAVDSTSKVFRTLSITSVMSVNRFSVKPHDVTSVATPCHHLTSGKTSLLSNVRLNVENMQQSPSLNNQSCINPIDARIFT